MRIVAHDLAILAGARFGLVGVDDEIMRASIRLLRHERPLEPGRESSAAAAAQARRLDLVDDRIAPLGQDRLGPVPCATFARAFEPPIMEAVKVTEDSVFICEHGHFDFEFASSSKVVGPPIGAESCRFTCGPGFGLLPAASASSSWLKLSLVKSS